MTSFNETFSIKTNLKRNAEKSFVQNSVPCVDYTNDLT